MNDKYRRYTNFRKITDEVGTAIKGKYITDFVVEEIVEKSYIIEEITRLSEEINHLQKKLEVYNDLLIKIETEDAK